MDYAEVINSSKKFFKDLLFPVNCVSCNKEGEWWCSGCRIQCREERVVSACPVCSRQLLKPIVCEQCRAVSSVDGVTALFNYTENSAVAALIQAFKYRFVSELTELWQECLVDFVSEYAMSVIMPVPLHPRRQRERGFNQAALVARLVSRRLGWCLEEKKLARTLYTHQQAKLSRVERLHNLANAFVWNVEAPAPERVLLVDDVFTTGATMQACAKVLKNHGSKEVFGFVLARAPLISFATLRSTYLHTPISSEG